MTCNAFIRDEPQLDNAIFRCCSKQVLIEMGELTISNVALVALNKVQTFFEAGEFVGREDSYSGHSTPRKRNERIVARNTVCFICDSR